MKIGVFSINSSDSEDPSSLARRSEELGFNSFWVPDHIVIPVATTSPFPGSPNGEIPDPYNRIRDPFVSLGRASSVTKSIKLGTGICLVPERHPLLTAKEVATLDHLSGGRFLFGIGAGWLKEETEVMGGDFQRRWTQTRDAVLAMKELWCKDESEYHGRYYDFPAVRSFPKPVQQPHPPVYLGGDARRVFERIIEYGNGWLPVSASPSRIKEGRDILFQLAKDSGRDSNAYDVIALGRAGQYMEKEIVCQLKDAGANEVVIWLNPEDGMSVLEKVARELLA